MHSLRSTLAAAVLAALLSAPAALAAETTGRGANIEPVKNLPYADGAESNGSDLEFHEYTIDGVQKRFAFAGSYEHGLQVVDITNPERSEIVAVWDCGVTQGDVQIFTRPDLGDRVFVAYTHDDPYTFKESDCSDDARALGFDVGDGAGTFFADITDPYHPETVSFVAFDRGSHNGTVHPSGRYFYNSNSDTLAVSATLEIADITDLSAPERLPDLPLMTFPGLGTDAHDLSFSADGSRAYVAALSHAEILDTTDPAAPVSIGKLVDPAINVWHQAEPITIDDPILGEREFMIVEDEAAGATATGQCPNGGVHVYDITDQLETAPVKVGYWNIDDVGLTEDGVGRCTAHVFQLHREQQLMTIAYYNGGVRVVDLSGLVGVALGKNGVGMKQLGWYRFKDSDTWAVKAPVVNRAGFYLYGNDHRRGFDVYEYKPSVGSAARVSPGIWMNPAQALRVLGAASGDRKLLRPLCLVR